MSTVLLVTETDVDKCYILTVRNTLLCIHLAQKKGQWS